MCARRSYEWPLTSESQIETADGDIFAPGTNRKMTFRELGCAVRSDIRPASQAGARAAAATALYEPFFGTGSSAAHIVEVEIDRESFQVAVRRYVVAEDAGAQLIRSSSTARCMAGWPKGIGAPLLEEVIDETQGQAVTASLDDDLVLRRGAASDRGRAHGVGIALTFRE